MTGIFLVEYLAGWISVTRLAGSSSALAQAFAGSLVVYIAVGASEEFTFRGYQLRNLAEGLAGRRTGARSAIVLAFLVSSAVFGLAHVGNPGATTISTINIVLGGLVLSLPYVLTGELAIPIGLHVSWNLFQAGVYGFPVSGNTPTRTILLVEQGGPTLWTGGKFGPEAGLLAVVWLVIGCGLILLWIKWREKRLILHAQLARYEPLTKRSSGVLSQEQPYTCASSL
jgi:uncharacterized protein